MDKHPFQWGVLQFQWLICHLNLVIFRPLGSWVHERLKLITIDEPHELLSNITVDQPLK